VTPDGRTCGSRTIRCSARARVPSSDTCTPGSSLAAGDTTSFVYEVSTETLSVVGVARSAWCKVRRGERTTSTSSSQLCLDRQHRQRGDDHLVATIPVGAYPRGIAISPDLTSLRRDHGFGRDRRHQPFDFKVVGQIAASTRAPLSSIPRTGLSLRLAEHPGRRRQDQSTDRQDPRRSAHRLRLPFLGDLDRRHGALRRELSLQHGDRVAASNLKILQSCHRHQSVGVTYDGTTGRVWVAVYTGEILVFNTKP